MADPSPDPSKALATVESSADLARWLAVAISVPPGGMPGVAVTLAPMRHWSARHVFDRNKALWAAFVIETPAGKVAVRSDRCELAADGTEGLPAVVRAIEYQGAQVLVHLLPPGGGDSAEDDAPSAAWVVSLSDDRFHQAPVAPGQSLRLRWAPGQAWALAA
mgnify:CR=1 FL=1